MFVDNSFQSWLFILAISWLKKVPELSFITLRDLSYPTKDVKLVLSIRMQTGTNSKHRIAMRPRAASKPSTQSLIARGLVRNASDRVQRGSTAVPVKSSPRKCYTLYSSESESDRVGSINYGLDRCASLLANILEDDEKDKPTNSRRVTNNKIGKQKKAAAKTQGGTQRKRAKKTNQEKNVLPKQMKMNVNENKNKALNGSPVINCTNPMLKEVKTLVQNSVPNNMQADRQVIGSPFCQCAEKPEPNQIATQPLIASKTQITSKTENQSSVDLSPRYQGLEDALLRITSKLNRPLFTKMNARVPSNEDLEDSKIMDSSLNIEIPRFETCPQKCSDSFNLVRKNRYLTQNPMNGDLATPLLDMPKSSLPDQVNNTTNNSVNCDSVCLDTVAEVNNVVQKKTNPSGNISYLTSSFNSDCIDISCKCHENTTPVKERVKTPGINNKLIVNPDQNQSDGNGDKSVQKELEDIDRISVSFSETAFENQDQGPSSRIRKTSPFIPKPETETIRSPAKSPRSRQIYSTKIGETLAVPNKIKGILKRVKEHALTSGISELRVAADEIEANLKQMPRERCTPDSHLGKIARLNAENKDLKRALSKAAMKCQEYDKMSEVYEKALKTALEAKQDQIIQRNEQLELEKAFQEVLKTRSILEEKVDFLQKKLSMQENQLSHEKEKLAEEKEKNVHKTNELVAKLSQSELSLKLQQKETCILKVTLQQSQAECERLKDLNSGLKQSLANLMDDLQSQGVVDLSPIKRIQHGITDVVITNAEHCDQIPVKLQNYTENHRETPISCSNSLSTVDELEFNNRLRNLDFNLQKLQDSLKAKKLKM